VSNQRESLHRPRGAVSPAAFLGEGMTTAAVVVLAGQVFYQSIILLLLGFYISWRAGRVRQVYFWAGFCLGALAVAAIISGLKELFIFKKALEAVILAAAVFAAYHLFSGVYFFATYYHTPLAWVTTLAWAFLTGLFVWGSGAGEIWVIITPLLWLCFLPLWAAFRRLLHSLLFAVTYLLVLYILEYFGGGADLSWPVAVAVTGLALVPEFLGYLYPGRKHPLDSLPVITPTLNWQQKLKAWREVFFLLADFYALYMERYAWFKPLARCGRYVICLGGAGEVLVPLLDLSPWLVGAGGLLALAGMVVELGAGNYGVMIPGLGFYGAAMAAGRGFLAGPVRYFPLVCGTLLVLLSLALWLGRPRETVQELQRWKELNSLTSSSGGQ